MNALKIAATGMMAQQTNVELLSNNISNMTTTGFKRQKASFKDLMYNTPRAVGSTASNTGAVAPTGVQVGLGVQLGATYKIFEQGAMQKTGSALDIGIQGRGFLQITMPNGDLAYTRDGSLELNENGDIVTNQGYLLDPVINVPQDATNLTISANGSVSAKVGQDIVDLGEITMAMFVNEAGLENIGGNLMQETVASGAPITVVPTEDGSGSLLQFHVEGSNVNAIEAVTDLIAAQRAYELNSRVISTADEMLNAVNQMR